MKLLDNLYHVIETSKTESGFAAIVQLFPDHIVYAGHFPGHPVTPGVVQLQIVHELIEKNSGTQVKLLEMPNCKFLKVLNPVEAPFLTISVDISKRDQGIYVKASGKNESDIFFKFSAVYLPEGTKV